MTDALDALLRASDLVAVLGREVVVRLMDISSAGCLLESNCRLEKGATGLLRVRFEDAEYMDDVRVMRCQESEGEAGSTSWAPSSCGRQARTSVRCDASSRSCRGRRCGASRSNDRCKFKVLRRVCRRGLSGRAHSRPAKIVRAVQGGSDRVGVKRQFWRPKSAPRRSAMTRGPDSNAFAGGGMFPSRHST